jgi:glutamyl-tRNA reductase
MRIYCLGINHTTAAVDLRERLSFSEEKIRAALSRLGCGDGIGSIAELIILSTCNRIELYAASPHAIGSELEVFLCEAQNISMDEIHPHTYHFDGMEAARHLMKVTAGLDSLVLGEPQILGQALRALELSRGQNAAGPVLNRLFQAAIHAGKRARTETNISRNPASVSSLAAALSERSVQSISESKIVILGAGEMAELAVEALRKRGANRILVVNRSLDRAQNLVQRWNAEATTFENLDEALASADIVISSTGAPHIIVTPGMIQRVMQLRPQRPLVLIDIAVPRDIDPEVANVPAVKLYDIDHLNERLEHSLAERAAQVPQVKAILEEEAASFSEYLKSMKMLPIIADIRQQAEAIRQAELEKTLNRMPNLTDNERARIEAMTQALVKKILQEPTQRLRAEADCPHAPEYATVARTLFGLKHDNSLCGFSGNACPISIAAD